MLLQVIAYEADVCCNRLRLYKYLVIDFLQNVGFFAARYLPGTVYQSITKRKDLAFIGQAVSF